MKRIARRRSIGPGQRLRGGGDRRPPPVAGGVRCFYAEPGARSTSSPTLAGGGDQVRIDQPGSLASVPPTLVERLDRLAPSHPSSPVDAGARKAAYPGEPSLRDLDGSRPLTDAGHAEHVADVRTRLEQARAEGRETHLLYTIDPDHEQWSKERTLLHDAIIDGLYRAAGAVPCERRAILAGGLPGAGKTTVLAWHEGIDRSRFLTVNPDDIKGELARRGKIPRVAGLTPMEASDLVHEESSYIAKRLARRAMRDGKNIIWDITMSSRESTERRIADLRAAGYTRVDGIFVDIPVALSARRADARHREGHDDYRAGQGLGGRFVPGELILGQADREMGSRARRTFEAVKDRLDGWELVDNSAERAPVRVDGFGHPFGPEEEKHDQ
jgi:predicted kinase